MGQSFETLAAQLAPPQSAGVDFMALATLLSPEHAQHEGWM